MKNLIFILLCIGFLSSCSTSNHLLNKEVPNLLMDDKEWNEPVTVIQPGDKLTISIWGHEELSIGSVNSSFSSNEGTGRWVMVDPNGALNLPKVGRLTIAGYSISEANYFLEQAYGKILKDPIINVRVLNHYITVLGEVKEPGRYKLENDHMRLTDVIGEAGGMTDHALSKSVRVFRQNNGKEMGRNIDLQNFTSFNQQNVVLRRDDLVYIPPKKSKAFNGKIGKVAAVAGVLSSAAVLITVLKK